MAIIPSVGKERNAMAVLRRVMDSAWWGQSVTNVDVPPIALNNEWLTIQNAAGTGVINAIKVNTANEVELGAPVVASVLGGEAAVPFYKTVPFRSGNVGTAIRDFWLSDGDYTVIGIQEIHGTAETTAATCVGGIQKLSPANVGAELMSSTFNLKGTANTLQTATLSTVSGATSITTGDRLRWTISATSTELSTVTVNVILAPGNRNNQATFYFSNTAATDAVFFIANRPLIITRVDYMHVVAASSACTLQLHIDTGTDAPGAGTLVLTNNASAGFDCAAAASVVQNGLFTAGTRVAAGQRLAANFTGTTTGLAGGTMTVTFAPSEDRKDVTFYAQANGTHVDANFFIADRAYYIDAASAIWSTAAASGNAQLTVSSGTTAVASGVDTIALDTNAGFQQDGTANTVEVGTFISNGVRFLNTGDRLGVDFSVTTSLVGFVCTVTLVPA